MTEMVNCKLNVIKELSTNYQTTYTSETCQILAKEITLLPQKFVEFVYPGFKLNKKRIEAVEHLALNSRRYIARMVFTF